MPGTALGASFININSVPNSITVTIITIIHVKTVTTLNQLVYTTRSFHRVK